MLGSVLPMANPVAASPGKIIPTDKAKVDLLKKFHIPKATELSKSELDMCLAYMAGRIAMSAPKLAPENIIDIETLMSLTEYEESLNE